MCVYVSVCLCVCVKTAIQEVGWGEGKREKDGVSQPLSYIFTSSIRLWYFILFHWDPFSIDCNYFEVLSSHWNIIVVVMVQLLGHV